jgi:Protein of unknown function (DUF2637)
MTSSTERTGRADRTIRTLTVAAVTGQASIAAAVSYGHIDELARRYGQTGLAPRLTPLSIDGLIIAAGMILLYEARGGRPRPRLAQTMLWLGIGATIAANAAAGAAYGVMGAIVSALPAAAFTGGAELVMGMARRGAWLVIEDQGAELDAAAAAAALVFAGDLAAGQVPPIRAIRAQCKVGQPRAQRIQAHLAVLAANL